MKFYFKILSNFYIMLNAVRIYDVNLLKANRMFQFYIELFAFLLKSIIDDRHLDPTIDDAKNQQEHTNKRVFLFEFLLAVYVHHRSILYQNPDIIDASQATGEALFTQIKQVFISQVKPLDKVKKEQINGYIMAIEVYELIVAYAQQFQRKPTAALLKENASYEKKLITKLTQLHKSLEKDLKGSVYASWLLNALLDFFFSIINQVYISHVSLHTKYMQDSLLDCLRQMSFTMGENMKRLYTYSLSYNPQPVTTANSSAPAKSLSSTNDVFSKSGLYKPMAHFISIGKLIEVQLKNSKITYLKKLFV